MPRPATYSTNPLIARLRAERLSQDLSMVILAKKIGVVYSYISDWERGRYAPTMPLLVAWVNALGLEIVLLPKESR